MNLPDKLTLTRFFTAPLFFFVWYFFIHQALAPFAASILLWILFFLSEITDLLDGIIARATGKVSDLGKLLDPFFDIFLRLTYFVCFFSEGFMPIWTLIIILWREMGMLLMRLLIVREGVVLAANWGGKIKSFLYFFSGFLALLALSFRLWLPDLLWQASLENVVTGFFIMAAIASIISFAIYFSSYRQTETHQHFISG